MAQLVVSAVGAAVGFMIGGPAGAQIGWVAGSMVGAYAFAENQTHEGPRLKDLKITGTDYGETIPWVAGSPRIAGQIIWASNRREHAHTEEQGGKGGGGGATSTTYTYSVDLLIMLTENPISGVSRVWANNELVWANGVAKDGLWSEMRVYTGDESQLPDPLYEAAVGGGDAPAYRGRGYVVIQNLDLGGGGSIPNLTFEVDAYQDVRESMLVCVFVGRAGTPEFLKWDSTQTQQPTWQSYFSEYKNSGLMRYVSYTPQSAPGDTGVLSTPTLISINPKSKYRLSALNAYWTGDRCAFRFEFLDASGAEVITLYSPGDGGYYSHQLFYGVNNSGLMLAGTYSRTNGIISFEDGLFRFANGDGGSSIFTFPCDARSVRSVRVRDVRVISTYTGSGYGAGAYVQLQKIPPNSSASRPLNSLESVVEGLMLRAGYSEDDFDSTPLRAISKPVRALALSQVASTRSALEVLQKGWFFDCSSADKIIFSPRATQSTVRIPLEDLGFSQQSGGQDDPLALRMGNDLEQPAQLALSYANMAGDYNADTQFSDRLVTGQASTQTLQLPLGMMPAEAKAVVDALLFDMVASMHSTTLNVPMRYAFVQAGDDIEAVAQGGRVLRLHVQQRKDNGVWCELECTLSDVGALESAAITDTGYITVTDPTRVPETVWEAMDIPILRDADDASGYYLAAAPQSINYAIDQWKGAVAARSWDGLEYQHLLQMLDAAVLGACQTVLPAWTGGAVFDEASTLTVSVWGQLASSTREAMLLDDRINALLVGAEVVRFRHADLLDTDEVTNVRRYRLSSFLRGQRGTEWAISGHVADERCVLLTSALRRVNSQSNEMQAPMQLKVLTRGKLLSSVQPRDFTDTGVGLKPFSPAGLRALVDANGVHLSWQRRTRLSYRYGGADPVVPLGEASERYRVQVFAGDLLLRTEIVTQPSYDYTTTLAATDGLSTGDRMRFEVCQLSESVGAGYITTKEGIAA